MKFLIRCFLLVVLIATLTLTHVMTASAAEATTENTETAATTGSEAGTGETSDRTADGADETLGLWEIMQRGGLLMWVLLAGSVLALAVFIERIVYYRRRQINVAEFLTGILSLIRRHRYLEALERCDEAHGPVVNVVRTAIAKRHLPPELLRDVVRETAQLETPRLEANLPILATVGHLSPLVGLLGTVIGMIEAFLQITHSGGSAPIADLAQGIWTALITTAGGLTIAIPCFAAYNYLVTRCNHLVADMERSGIEIVHTLAEPRSQEHADAIGSTAPHPATLSTV